MMVYVPFGGLNGLMMIYWIGFKPPKKQNGNLSVIYGIDGMKYPPENWIVGIQKWDWTLQKWDSTIQDGISHCKNGGFN